MEWIERNVDAYRIVAEILTELRTALRAELEALHGRDWPSAGLPRPTLERLVERKEREKAIDWHETDYQELTDYFGFEEVLEVLEGDPRLLREVRSLAPSGALIHTRFLELEVMRAKIGLGRQVSESELSFLGTFHVRFRKAMDAHRTARRERPPEQDTLVVVQRDPAVAPEPAPGPPAVAPVTPVTPVMPVPAPPVAPPSVAPPSPAAEVAPIRPERSAIDVALESEDHRTIFRELYREVMEIAESLWTSDVPIPPRVWDRVRVSSWYKQGFSKRGLKPLSDFYEVISQVWEKMEAGIARDELQEFLKESNFAQLLLALRDMFQKNQV